MLNYYYLEMRAHEKIAEALSDAARDRITLTANNARREAQRSTGATLANLLRAFAVMFGFGHSSRVSHTSARGGIIVSFGTTAIRRFPRVTVIKTRLPRKVNTYEDATLTSAPAGHPLSEDAPLS